jgi:hypothetical protein
MQHNVVYHELKRARARGAPEGAGVENSVQVVIPSCTPG